jgi:hypothetical protein
MASAAWAATTGGMADLLDYPLALLVVSLLLQWTAAILGRLARRSRGAASDPQREEIVTVLNASFTLLALLIGFSFAMAVSRYDQRKDYEEAEANAIGTEYLRADLLPRAAGLRVHALLVAYAEQRIAYYQERDEARLGRMDADTARLQDELWSTVAAVAAQTPTPTMALVANGMNDVINTQGYTQAAWWNRIPVAAWVLILTVAIACNALLGRVESRVSVSTLLVLPLILSISLFLIADVDSPRRGVIQVQPHNLVAMVRALPPRPMAPAAPG